MHDFGTPVRQEGSRHRDEDPLGQFDDPDAFECACQSIGRWPEVNDDDGDAPIGPGLVDVVVRPHLASRSSTAGVSLRRRPSGHDRDALRLDLDLGLRVRQQVPVPLGVLGGTTHGGNHQVVVAVPAEDERRWSVAGPLLRPVVVKRKVGTPFQR